MRLDKPNGGPAFPQPLIETRDGAFEHPVDEACGMSVRDYFAGQALAGFAADGISRASLQIPEGTTMEKVLARACYLLADALLVERAK